jgi:hypothetical protein
MDVQGFLADLRRRLRRVLLLDGLATLLVLLLGGTVVAVLLDYVWSVPAGLRLVLLLALVGATAVAIHRRLVRPLARRMDDRTLASLAERRMPELDGHLLTRVDGIELGELGGRTLRERLGGDAVVALVPAPELPRRMMLAGTVLLSAVLVLVFFPRTVQDGMMRLLLPFGDTEWERSARLSGQLERPVVADDQPVVVRLRREKGPAAAMQLGWRPLAGGQVAGETRMLSGLSGPWSQALNLAPGSYRITAESGDALPVRLDALVVRRPQLARVNATVTPPAYTRLPAQDLETLGCTPLPGSTIAYTVVFTLDEGREVASASVALDGETLPSERQGAGLSGSFTVRRAGTLVLSMADQDGIGPAPEPRFTLALAEDRKPQVALTGPRAKETVTLRAQVRLEVQASDDYGLASLALRARAFSEVPAGDRPAAAPTQEPAPAREQLTPFADVGGQTATARQRTIAVAELAKEGDRLVLVGLASDANDVTGPGTGESQAVELKVVSETELRQELDRLLGEARDRVVQARDELAQGLAKNDRLALGSRSAAMAASRAGELLAQVVRRWSENQLPGDQGEPIGKAEGLVNRQALARLAEASRGAEPPARQADIHLAEAEQILASLLQEGDLTRVLASLIERQRSLGEESRAFVREHLTKPLDEAAKARQANLAQRQQELADQVKEVERRILSSPSSQLDAARELVRSGTPADQLQQAAKEVASERERTRAVPHQEAALKTLEAVLDQLRGNDAAKDLAKRAGELAARQEEVVRRLEEGSEPRSQADEQQRLRNDTEQLRQQLAKQPEAEKQAGAATQSQGAAKQAMDKGDRAGATREAAAAADLLRAIQEQLEPKPQKPDESKDKRGPDVVRLLKDLHRQQRSLVTDSTVIHQRIGDEQLDFAASREVPLLAERESDILLRLREEGMKELERMPIALVSLERVAAALERTATHLATPALGERGMRLEKIALHELARLIEIVETMPEPEQEPGDQPPSNGQQGPQPPFPPAAQLALLAAAQDELAVLTAANRPADLPQMQKELRALVGVLLESSRPGTRPNLLLARSSRAMGSAADLLEERDRGATTRHEQAAATAALRRLIAEAKGQSGSSGNQPPPSEQQRRPGQAPPAGAPGQPQPGNGPGGASTGPAAQGGPKGEGATQGVLTTGAEKGQFMHLPPERREQLQQARQQNLPPAALSIFERYLEVLEDGR